MTNTRKEVEEYIYENGLGLESNKIDEIVRQADKYEDKDTRECEIICLVHSAVEDEEMESEDLHDDEDEPTAEEKFNYMMLSRLQSDCNYYLGYGGRHKKSLWADNEEDQINEMKKLYNQFDEDKKPEWLTWDDILNYESQMII